MRNTDSLSRRVQRLEDQRDAKGDGPTSVAASLELQDGKADREVLEQVDAACWPPWPPEADGYHHAWVREHWTPEAAEEWDFLTLAVYDVNYHAANVLADEVYAGEPLADAFAAAGLDAPPDDYAGTARDHLATIRGPHVVETFDSRLSQMDECGAKWPTQPPAFREQDRRWLGRAERICTDPTDEARARVLSRRGIGIRGEGYDWRIHTQNPLSHG